TDKLPTIDVIVDDKDESVPLTAHVTPNITDIHRPRADCRRFPAANEVPASASGWREAGTCPGGQGRPHCRRPEASTNALSSVSTVGGFARWTSKPASLVLAMCSGPA